ncbi:MAG: NINE protein [Candidatus Sumerlaeaceae bacterium]|nr:NINE protein [Candidatus Sumerlaeaceae bacterium]
MPHKSSSAGTNIGEILLREGLITNAQLDMALARQRETDKPLMRILVESGFIDETRRLNFFKRQFGIPLISLETIQIDPILYTYIPAQIARRHHLVPIKLDRDGLVVAMEDPSDLVLIDNLKELVGLRIKPVVAPSAEIQAALEGYPEEEVSEKVIERAEKFDPAVRFFSWFFLPMMSAALLVGMAAMLTLYEPFQRWLQNHLADNVTKSAQAFTVFLYFFLTWGVWTIIMYEIRGLVFDDFQWRDPAELGPPRSRKKAMFISLFFGWLGIDRFYLGYRGPGILKLLTLGLVGFWWIFDFVLLLLNKIPDAAGRPLE